jgi:hypothetical protein
MLLLMSVTGIFHIIEQTDMDDTLISSSLTVSDQVPDGLTAGEWDNIVSDIKNYEYQVQWDDASSYNKLRIYCYGSGASGRELVTNTTFQTGNWYHVVVTSNPNDVKYYVNGAFDSQHALMDVVFGGGDNDDDDLVIGGSFRNTDLYPFNGTIDEIRVWARVLNATEVYQQYVSNLQKFSRTRWYLTINQSKNATADLDYGSYNYQVFVNDSYGNSNQTMQRTITILNLSSPTNFTASATSSSGIDLSWTKDSYATNTYIRYQQG